MVYAIFLNTSVHTNIHTNYAELIHHDYIIVTLFLVPKTEKREHHIFSRINMILWRKWSISWIIWSLPVKLKVD
jgi:hypothetical protein